MSASRVSPVPAPGRELGSRTALGTATTGRRGSRGGLGPERGSGTVLVIAAIAVLVLVGSAGLTLAAATVTSHRAAAAGDASALSAAMTRQGGGDGCEVARRIAARNSAELAQCREDPDESVTVNVTVPLTGALAGFGAVHARARAGPVELLDGDQPGR